jgi:hypothetical protein
MVMGAADARSALHAVQTQVLAEDIECRTCTIQAFKQVELGGEEGEGYVDITARIAVTPDRIIVVNLTARHELRVFTRDGTFVETVGTAGGGPTDFRSISDLRYDSRRALLYVLDAGNSRIAVLDRQLRIIRLVPLPGRPIERGLLPLEDGGFLFNGVVATAERAGFPLHVVDSAGSIVTSFGTDIAALRPDQAFEQIQRIAHSSLGFWAAGYTRYRIDRYDFTGRHLQTLVREPRWYREWSSPVSGRGRGEPMTNILDVQEDEQGRLWVISRKADPNWRSSISRTTGVHGASLGVDSYTGYFNTVIDVIDPATASLIATAEWEGYVVRFVGPNTVAICDDSTGEPRISVWVLALEAS